MIPGGTCSSGRCSPSVAVPIEVVRLVLLPAAEVLLKVTAETAWKKTAFDKYTRQIHKTADFILFNLITNWLHSYHCSHYVLDQLHEQVTAGCYKGLVGHLHCSPFLPPWCPIFTVLYNVDAITGPCQCDPWLVRQFIIRLCLLRAAVHSKKPICTPPHLSNVFPVLPFAHTHNHASSFITQWLTVVGQWRGRQSLWESNIDILGIVAGAMVVVDGGAGVVTLAAAGVKVQELELLKVMSSIAMSPV